MAPAAAAAPGARQKLLGGQKRLLEEATFFVRDAIDRT